MGRLCLRVGATLLAAALLSACSTMTSFSSIPADGGRLDVKTSAQNALPRSDSFEVTTFGHYEFKAEAPGKEPLYGQLPLTFNGGYLALDIIFLAPLAFKNLRGVYPFYEIDLDQRVVRFKREEEDEWRVYTPTEFDIERAKALFAAK